MIHADDDYCRLADTWGVDPSVMLLVLSAALQYKEETRGTVEIISGLRTRAEQMALARRGRPAARDDLSTHRSCPATGVDISLGLAPVRMQIAAWGRIVTFLGLRWGGGGPVDPGGIPIDWQHVDRGPRNA